MVNSLMTPSFEEVCMGWSRLPPELWEEILKNFPIEDSIFTSSMQPVIHTVQDKSYRQIMKDEEMVHLLSGVGVFWPQIEEESSRFFSELHLLIARIKTCLAERVPELFESSPMIGDFSHIKSILQRADDHNREQFRVSKLLLQGHGLSINLKNSNITGVPIDLTALPNVTSLDLSRNSLRFLPFWLSRLGSLTKLDLSHTQLVEIPDWFGLSTQLTSLSLFGNSLTTLSQGLQNLVLLEKLDLRENDLEQVPQWIRKLKRLNGLFLSNNRISALPEEMKELASLKILDISNNRLKEIPAWLQGGGITIIS